MTSSQEQTVIDSLTANWVWIPDWVDSSTVNTAGRVVCFTREFTLSATPLKALLRFSADTRYKLYVNGERIAVGPCRGSQLLWYYDTLDIAPYLKHGHNVVKFIVVRYFLSVRAAMPFARTAAPGLTVCGTVETDAETVSLNSNEGWMGQADESIHFPIGLVDDVFLHINERTIPSKLSPIAVPKPYNIKTLNGELSPWRLRPRPIPMPEESHVGVGMVRFCQSDISTEHWEAFLSKDRSLALEDNSTHVLEIQADVHSTAFLQWTFKASHESRIKLKATYSEGYELEPRVYPFFRTKADRLDNKIGKILGPFDEVDIQLAEAATVTYEPFWFRTFRIIRLELSVGTSPVELVSFRATQVNYPLAVKGSWREPFDTYREGMWDVSVRTLRNCMFDGYSDCPFYEQLQYAGDSRQVALFHYLISGDDQLMRQAISTFAASVTFDGLPQSRFPSHVPQIIAVFSLYWILAIYDHDLYFGDRDFTRALIPRIDGVLDFFDRHLNDQGLVANLPGEVWQYVDWVTAWGATDEHPDKGVPTAGRKNNLHTFFSMAYAYVLIKTSELVRRAGRPGHASEYLSRATAIQAAIRSHCYDGEFFTDSTADTAGESRYSQHCQVFAVLSGAAPPEDHARLLTKAFAKPNFSKCSYFMKFYVLRAFAQAGDEVYESYWQNAWDPWKKMLAANLTTWEEDDVRQRSDCHAWGSVPLYEFCTELAGVHIVAAGASKVLFKPRVGLSRALSAKIALGRDNLATVSWDSPDKGGTQKVELHLERAINVTSQLPGFENVEHGVVNHVSLVYGG